MRNILVFTISIMLCFSCEKAFLGKEVADNPHAVFNSLWKTLDERYSFFELKNIDWNAVGKKYEAKIKKGMSQEELFDVCADMLNELKDGHVNLIAPFKTSSYSPLFYSVPENYNERLIYDYYVEEFHKTGPFNYGIISRNGKNFGYLYYGSFSQSFSEGQVEYVMKKLQNTDGLILDIRNNKGGLLSMINPLVQFLAQNRQHIYTSYLKTGSAHNAFDQGTKVYVNSHTDHYKKNAVVLTNRFTYSASTMFSSACKVMPNVTIIGDTTGGGGGIPAGAQLPNGWNYRFSATRTQLPNGYEAELGIIPDIVVWMDFSEEINGIDTILETAISVLTD